MKSIKELINRPYCFRSSSIVITFAYRPNARLLTYRDKKPDDKLAKNLHGVIYCFGPELNKVPKIWLHKICK
ncbi:hypothetical protein RRG08_040260 [Elysia crispata]|uniref:Uncharacterized protein n=1 Tax=Elysia crispata TaxID=231223 RepID=A0AAE1CVX0_9GAST|nr:hypothetical protein RRG08_040260 [Elysia crispata]